MSDAALDNIEARQLTGEERLTPTERKRAEERTAVPDQKLDVTDTPAYWTEPAVVAWLLSRDPSEVVALCEPFPTGDEIVQGAERLRRLKSLELLASRKLGIDAGEERREAIAAEVRELHDALVARKLTRDRWHRYYSLLRLLMRQRSQIAKTIDDAIHELFEMLTAEKLAAVDDDLKLVPSRKFSRILTRHRFVESRVGQRDVVIAREQVLQCWPGAVPKARTPGRPSNMCLVEDELDRRMADGAIWPDKTSAATELSRWLKETHPNALALKPKAITNRLGHKIPVRPKAPPKTTARN